MMLISSIPASLAHAQPTAPVPSPVTPMSMNEARGFFICKTHMSFSRGHGTQVSFMHPDGLEFLWYPGNSVIVQGKWELRSTQTESARDHTDLCFQYGANTYNPVTKQWGGRWECRPAAIVARTTIERAPGDVFGLARRPAVPFVLSRERTTIKELRRKFHSEHPNERQSERSVDRGCPHPPPNLRKRPVAAGPTVVARLSNGTGMK